MATQNPSLSAYLTQSTLGTLVLYGAVSAIDTTGVWVEVVSVYVLGVLLLINGLYGSTVRQLQRLESFSQQGLLYRLLSGRIIRWVFHTGLALAWALPVFIQLRTYTPGEWVLFAGVIPVFWGAYRLSRRWLAAELKPYLVTAWALRWARWVTAVVMLLLTLALQPWLDDAVDYPTLQAATAAQQQQVAALSDSALVQSLASAMAYIDGAKAYVFGRSGLQGSLTGWLIVGVGHLALFYLAAAMLSTLLIPRAEYRRLFGPLTMDPSPPPVTPSRVGWTVAVMTFVSLFVYVPLATNLELTVRQSPQVAQLQAVQTRVRQRLEQIDQEYFQEGTLAALVEARLAATYNIDAARATVLTQADRAFAQMELNVDDFLDWYYSLGGEIARIGSLLVGEIEPFLADKLQETVMQGAALDEMETALRQLLTTHPEVLAAYEADVTRILQARRVETPAADFDVVATGSRATLLPPVVDFDPVAVQGRLLTSAGGGALAGVIGATVVKKVIGKTAFKTAAQAVGKLVVSKSAGALAGAGAGAGTGAVIGSVVPGFGTAVGAAVGGLIGGIAAGLAVDAVLIELDEWVNRNEFRQQILDAIAEARREFQGLLSGESPVGTNVSPGGL